MATAVVERRLERPGGVDIGIVVERLDSGHPIPDTLHPASGDSEPGSGRSVWDVRRRLQENFDRVESILREMEASSDPKQRLAAAEEIRQHIGLAEKTLETAARAEAVEAFEEAVLEALAAASVTVRKKVIATLNARAGRPPDHAEPAGSAVVAHKER